MNVLGRMMCLEKINTALGAEVTAINKLAKPQGPLGGSIS